MKCDTLTIRNDIMIVQKKVYQLKKGVTVSKYTQINNEERVQLFIMLQEAQPKSIIAKTLSRHRSVIYREISRNARDKQCGYLPDTAQHLAEKRRKNRGLKIDKLPEIKEKIETRLKEGWSPDAIAGRMKLDKERECISRETIYQYIYNPEGQKKELFRFLLRRRPVRGKLYGRTPRKSSIPERVSIHERPEQINNREEFGHLEGDLMFCKDNQSVSITTMVERKTRFVQLVKNSSKHSAVVIAGIFNKLRSLPGFARKTLTFDNGTEFTRHTFLKRFMKIQTYFCDKHSPWQKGQVEKTNAILRRYLPFNTNLNEITNTDLINIQNRINDAPRRCLGFKTPREVFNEKLKQHVELQAVC